MTQTLWTELSQQTRDMAENAFSEIETRSDWERIRPQRRLELLRSLGLDPLPEFCDLRLTARRDTAGKGFIARKISFQILPDCWAAGCIYYPAPLPKEPAPAVLYLCGHTSQGSHAYQAHAIMWARRGYVCLILDTIEQNDNPGDHHGSFHGVFPAWLSLGYTAAGGEVWNSLRALDVLAGDERVDAGRLGVTGVSGGGACSLFLAAIDNRLKAVSTLCGVSSPVDAVANQHLWEHCDCMYPHNLYRRDISEYAALVAPRAALFCFADHDLLFDPAETTSVVARTSRIYELLEIGERCQFVTSPGPHGDQPRFDEATADWFDRHVAGRECPQVARGGRELTEAETGAFQGQPPSPNHLDLLPELLSTRGTIPLPTGPEEWATLRQDLVEKLRSEIFHSRSEISFSMEQTSEWHLKNGSTLQRHSGTIDGTKVQFFQQSRPQADHLLLCLTAEGETMAQARVRVAGASTPKTASAVFEPRLSADRLPSRSPGTDTTLSLHTATLRAMALTGTTPVMTTMLDLRAAVDYLLALPASQGKPLYLYGRGEQGVAALYCSILDERIAGVILEGTPASHLKGAPILGILRHLDLQHAIGLMAPRKVALIKPQSIPLAWATRVFEKLGCAKNIIIAESVRAVLEKLPEM